MGKTIFDTSKNSGKPSFLIGRNTKGLYMDYEVTIRRIWRKFL